MHDCPVKLTKKNEIIVDRDSKTSMEGIWAAGDVTDMEFKQAITGVGQGVAAAYSIYQYIKNKKEKEEKKK